MFTSTYNTLALDLSTYYHHEGHWNVLLMRESLSIPAPGHSASGARMEFATTAPKIVSTFQTSNRQDCLFELSSFHVHRQLLNSGG